MLRELCPFVGRYVIIAAKHRLFRADKSQRSEHVFFYENRLQDIPHCKGVQVRV